MGSGQRAAEEGLFGHRWFKYRGCAPSPEDPGVALGDERVAVTSWEAPTEDGGEPQKQRLARERAALSVCATCPVLEACRTYGLAQTPEGRLVEPEGIWGGMLALDRHRHLIAARRAAGTAPAPVDAGRARTPQKQAVLRALARETDEELVAYRAGMDLGIANFHRSHLTRMLGLDQETATRRQLLDRAVAAGLLPASMRLRPDGPWPVPAAPNTDGTRQRRLAPGRPVQLVLLTVAALPRVVSPRERRRAAARDAAKSLRPASRAVARTRRAAPPAAAGPRRAPSPAAPGRPPGGRARLRLVTPPAGPVQPALPLPVPPPVLEPAA